MQLQGTMEIDEHGVLNIGGISVIDMVEEYGTPLMVFDEKEIRDNIKEYVTAFKESYPDYKVAYAGKAFLNRTLCKILEEEGLGLDVVSGGELYIALQAGFPENSIYFHGNNKLPDEIEMALTADIGTFMVDNYQEAHLLNQMAAEKGKQVEAILRITPGIEAHTHEYIQTGQLDSKFGVSFAGDQALDLIQIMHDYENIDLKGIHAHIGSQIFVLESYKRLIEVIFSFLDEVRDKIGYVLEELDLGGGLGISYLEEEEPPAITDYIETISQKTIDEAHKYDYPLPQLIVEPGRSIIGTAGTTLYRVGTIKQVPGLSKYVAVDGGMTDNIRPALYDAQYEAFLANRCLEKAGEEVVIAGKCCESGDILIDSVKLPETKSGDIVAVSCTGAYSYPMSSNYNGIPRPAAVLVNEGQSNIIIERESYDDLIKNDIIPEDYR